MATSRPLVISKSELARMQNLAINGESLSETSKRGVVKNTIDRRQQLHEKSRAETSKWSSTIEGNRQKRLALKAERLAKKEEDLKQLDLEEERFQAEQRKLLIENAQNLIFAQDDRVKGLRGADLLTEVLRERESHKDFKKEREAQLLDWERELDSRRMAAAEEEIRQEEEKMKKLHLDATKVAGSQLEQALKKRALRKAQRQMELAEQACLNEDAHNFALSEQKVHEAKRTRNFDFVKELHNQKSVKKTLEEHNKELLDLETEKNALYNTTKEAVTKEWNKQKQAAIQSRTSAVESLAMTITGPTADQIAYEVEQKNLKIMEEKFRLEDELQARKAYNRAAQQQKINMHRELTVEEKAAKRKAEVQMSLEEGRALEEEAHNLAAQELAKTERQREKARLLKDDHTKNIASHEIARAAEKQIEVEYRIQQSLKEEEDVKRLQDYAATRRDAAVARGCTNVYALEKAVDSLHPKQPKDYTANLPTTMVRRVGNPYPGNSKARMGFIF
eukprot:m.66722 g.66722  ORF g.66722 m.66722 type:complete len:506 (-) comp23718_c0_seq2:248-1765(-)